MLRSSLLLLLLLIGMGCKSPEKTHLERLWDDGYGYNNPNKPKKY